MNCAPRAAIVGAGGLGGPIALALADAGVELTIFDDDAVDLSNLHRQIQFRDADLGADKATALASAIHTRGGIATALRHRFTAETADRAALNADLLIDASDDPVTKFAVVDWAHRAGIPYVIASALRYGGNVFTGAPGSACYRCLFEDVPAYAPSCSDAGVLGPVVGWIGGVAAAAALRLLAGAADLGGRIWVLDDLRRGPARELRLEPRPGCACEGS